MGRCDPGWGNVTQQGLHRKISEWTISELNLVYERDIATMIHFHCLRRHFLQKTTNG